MKKVSLMSQMGEKYFKTESDQCLPLANQVIVYLVCNRLCAKSNYIKVEFIPPQIQLNEFN